MGAKRKTTCGHFGGVTAEGKPCGRKAGHGTDHKGEGACKSHNGSKSVLALEGDITLKPQNWDKAVSAAYLYTITDNLELAAKGAGVGARTLDRWKKSPWWYDACDEAAGRFIQAGRAETRRVLLAAIQDGDTTTGRWFLERTDENFAPPTQRHDIKVDYMHKDEVVRLMRLVGSEVSEVVVEETQRVEIVKRLKVVMEPLMREVSAIPEEE